MSTEKLIMKIKIMIKKIDKFFISKKKKKKFSIEFFFKNCFNKNFLNIN
jgi:hypothetical protein